MPCVGNLTTRAALRDLKFWKDYEATFEDNNWGVIFLCGYIVLMIVLWQKRHHPTYRLTRDGLVHLKTLTAGCFIVWYISVPLFLAFPMLRAIFYLTHIVSFYGAFSILRMSNQPREYQISINGNEHLGFLRSCAVASVFIFVQVIHTINSPRSRYYKCPASWLVTWEDVCFKLLILSHSVAYFIVKNLWISYRAETFSIFQDDQYVGNLVKRDGQWVEELTKEK